jgi:hypothetical protein
MAETPPKKVVDLTALGAHIGRTLAAHQERHEEGKLSVERVRRFDELKGRVNYLANGEGLTTKRSTNKYPVERLETGTNVAAAISNAYVSVLSAAKELIGDGARTKYMDEGPYSERIGSEPFARSEIDSKQLPAGTLSVGLHLETSHEANIDPTQDTVWVGSILDPESILVPEEPIGDGPERMSVIGPTDSRFSPIMDVLSHVNQAVGTRGEVPRTG